MDADHLLARLAEQPERTAVLLDVDGTLAPIVERPEESRVPEETRRVLAGLAGRYRLVACISGRPARDAKRVVGVDGIRYVGEHGLELAPDAELWAERLASFARASPWPPETGKRLSLSFHYRQAPDPAVARSELERVAERAVADGLRVRWGRMVLEVRPPVDADKGTAVRQLLAESGADRALYAGDDATDLDAFAALDDLALGVRVAVRSGEAPRQLVERADLSVDGPEALVAVLNRL